MILADSRWRGQHGIGRFASEVLARLDSYLGVPDSIPLLHPLEPLRLAALIRRLRPSVYFSPGFNPPLGSPCPLVFVIHDLIHLRFARETSPAKRLYYETVVKPAARAAARVLTVSECSKREIAEWASIDPERILVVGNGVSAAFRDAVPARPAERSYYLYVGNQKPHKNLDRVLEAFSLLPRGQGTILGIVGTASASALRTVERLRLQNTVQFLGALSDQELASTYRGALALVAPSLYEGFCLPALEAMACGCPVIASEGGAQAEILAGAGVLVDPLSAESIASAMETAALPAARQRLVERGLLRARAFSWDRTAGLVQTVLDEAAGRMNTRVPTSAGSLCELP